MIQRHLERKLRSAAEQCPLGLLMGPRQSGKTTLVRAIFPDYRYISLEDPDRRTFATENPRGFLGKFAHPPGIILSCPSIPEEEHEPLRSGPTRCFAYIFVGRHE